MKPLQASYGHWTVLRAVAARDPGAPYNRKAEVRCVCGTIAVRRVGHLTSGASTSCGCVGRAKRTTHGQAAQGRTAEYDAWVAMKQRCENPNNPRWDDYGGRGITVCLAWRDSFAAFYRDMGPRPSVRHSIDRKENDGHYEPDNCRWATTGEQASNKRPRRAA